MFKVNKLILSLVLVFVFSIMVVGTSFAARTVTLVTEPWPPYMGPKLLNSGFLSELTVSVLKEAGYETKIKFIPWARAVNMVKSGKADGLLGAYYTKERAEFLFFSDVVAESRTVLFMKKGGNISYNSLEDLRPYTIGTIRKASYSKEFDDADYLKKEVASKREFNIKKLMNGRIDLMAGPEDLIKYIIKNKFPQYQDEIVTLKPALKKNNIYIGFSKKAVDDDKIVKDFNAALKKIKESGEYRDLLEKHNFE